ncbi:uncharacterized protein MELLADRAFT_35374 [Melampsora larici-populina 98AG31]|uniref:Uncharacterized protein n=1 Tax=Melampsora larici-populina (strain 98AG31 / pathotype 3-4-7) TaxID=747676 RepID=F4RJ18_MELLP|nr:uncharacterized protein MELLADRAFT_35374 [Melampsora larici-populina 98AG31]EGG07657.1 hypothetical protein MELLADRAFT_35374 [Melampsora larici-populina 98AG31]
MPFIPQLKPNLLPIKTLSTHPPLQNIQRPTQPTHLFSTTSINPIKLVKTRAIPNNRKTSGRTYPIRKQFIFENYRNLFTKHKLNLFFRHQNLTPKEWNSIRGELSKLSNQQDTQSNPSKLKLQVIRTRMISPVLKSLTKDSKTNNPSLLKSFSSHLNGNLVCLSQDEFNPTIIQSALKILSKHASIPTQSQINQISKLKSNQTSIVIDRLPFVIGIIEDKVETEKSRVEELSRLPSLDVLRQQILALISSPGSRVVGTLNQARGEVVVRTVDGYRATLEKQEQGPPAS